MLNTLARFCLNLSDVVKAFRELTNKDVPVQWTDSHSKAFFESKELIAQGPIMWHFNPYLPITLQGGGEWANGSVDSENYFARIKDSERNFNGFADPKFAAVGDFIDFLGPDF